MTMALLKTWCLLPLAALLLLFNVPSSAEVVRSMSDCAEFLLLNKTPEVPGILEGGNILDQNRYKPICQTWRNTKRFLMLYDTINKIPVFSANKYRGDGVRRRPTGKGLWKKEPQLENNNKIMTPAEMYSHQPVNTDYRNIRSVERGDLFPSSYAFPVNKKISTFALTNIVPQKKIFNKRSWSRMEKCMKCVLDKYCINNDNFPEGFVVNGAQPSTNNLLNNKVNIPSMLWSAFCCYSHSENKWLASAYWGENTKDSYTYTETLAELHSKLSRENTSGFEVFPGTQCPLNTTVIQLYPNLKKDCKCPPPISSAPNVTTSDQLSTISACIRSSCTSEPLRMRHFINVRGKKCVSVLCLSRTYGISVYVLRKSGCSKEFLPRKHRHICCT